MNTRAGSSKPPSSCVSWTVIGLNCGGTNNLDSKSLVCFMKLVLRLCQIFSPACTFGLWDLYWPDGELGSRQPHRARLWLPRVMAWMHGLLLHRYRSPWQVKIVGQRPDDLSTLHSAVVSTLCILSRSTHSFSSLYESLISNIIKFCLYYTVRAKGLYTIENTERESRVATSLLKQLFPTQALESTITKHQDSCHWARSSQHKRCGSRGNRSPPPHRVPHAPSPSWS